MARYGSFGRACCWVLAAAAFSSVAAPAQEFGNVVIHAAGGVATGQTDGPNAYLAGTPEGSGDLRDLSLTVLATPTERLLIGAQVYWGVRDIFRPAEIEVNLTQVFAQYKVSDALKIRAGVSPQPFGLYSEILAIGTLRPFLTLPRGVYSPGVFQWEGYRGLGITGILAGESAWPVEYDLYGGELSSPSSGASPVFTTVTTSAVGQVLRDMVGGRVRLRTPVEGLVVGVSGYAATPETGLLGLPPDRQVAYLASFEFLRERWSLRSEVGHRDAGNDAVGDAAYVEGAYRLWDHWEVAARWDYVKGDLGPLSPLPPFLDSALDHRDLALGINYLVTDGLVFKASIHEVDGNFFAAPRGGVNFARGETLDLETRLIQCGAQFSF